MREREKWLEGERRGRRKGENSNIGSGSGGRENEIVYDRVTGVERRGEGGRGKSKCMRKNIYIKKNTLLTSRAA